MNIRALRAAARYAWRAETIYDIHAPLAFAFVGEVVEDARHFYAHDDIAALRERYAAAAVGRRRAAIPERYGRYLLSLVDWRGGRRVLELGSGAGIGSCCLAAGMPKGGRLVTIEADAELSAYAKTALAQTIPYADAEVLDGTPDERLGAALAALGRVDVAIVHGDYGAAATRDCFSRIRERCDAGSVVVLGGVHRSAEMEAAWAWARTREEVTLSFDLYHYGLVFFDASIRAPQHHTLVPWRWKPWHMGFFKSRR